MSRRERQAEAALAFAKLIWGIISWSLAFSIGCLIAGTKLARRGDSTACIPFLQWCFISMGIVFMVAFILSVACCCSGNGAGLIGAVWFQLCVKCLGLLVFLCLIIAAMVSINIKLTGYPEATQFDISDLPDVEPTEVLYWVPEYNLSDYGGSLRRRMADARYWATINKCLHHRHPCDGMSPMVRVPNTSLLFSEQGLSPIQSGCCKPPSSCGFTYVNQTTWIPTEGAPTNNTGDCGRWRNDQEVLCFECDSCKAAVLADIQKAWSKPVAVMLTILLVQIIIFPCVAAAIGRFMVEN